MHLADAFIQSKVYILSVHVFSGNLTHFALQEPSSTVGACWVVSTQIWVKYGQTQPLSYIFKQTVSPNG